MVEVRVEVGDASGTGNKGQNEKKKPQCPDGFVYDSKQKKCVPVGEAQPLSARTTDASLKQKQLNQRADEQRIEDKKRQADLERLRLLREQGLAGGVETGEQEAFVEEQQRLRGARVQGVQSIQEKEAQQQRTGELEQLAVESGAFEQVQQIPLINPELQGDPLAVTKDIFIADVLPIVKRFDFKEALKNDLKDISNFIKKPSRNEVEAAMQEQAIISSTREITTAQIDSEIENNEKVLIQNGIPLASLGGSIAGGIAGAAVISPVISPLAQSIGSDKKISNLGSALEKYDEIVTLPARAMDESGLTAEEALARIDRIETAVEELEAQLQRDAINSADVRISLRNAPLEVQIFKLRQKMNDQKRSVIIKGAERAFNEVDVSKSLSFSQELSRKYGKT